MNASITAFSAVDDAQDALSNPLRNFTNHQHGETSPPTQLTLRPTVLVDYDRKEAGHELPKSNASKEQSIHAERMVGRTILRVTDNAQCSSMNESAPSYKRRSILLKSFIFSQPTNPISYSLHLSQRQPSSQCPRLLLLNPLCGLSPERRKYHPSILTETRCSHLHAEPVLVAI